MNLLVSLLLFTSLAFASVDSGAIRVPATIPQGAILAVRIKAPVTLESAIVKWRSKEVTPYRNPEDPSEWVALFGLPHDTTIGKDEITVKEASGENKIAFEIVKGKFKSERLRVDPSKIKPSKKDQERIEHEAEETRALYHAPELPPLWKAGFHKPLKSELRSTYGTRRLFNGQEKRHHNGVDFRAAIGTKILASNAGRVRLSKELFLGGNTVIIEHGGGVFTIYGHLSRLDVSPGDEIKASQFIGLSGDTGRVNGPHLHWGVRIHGEEADPLELLKLGSP